MTERTLDQLEDRIGETLESVEGFTIEAGKVAEFASAIGDDNPLFYDSEAASKHGYEARPAPLMFTRVSMFPRYRPEGADRLGIDLGFDIQYELHGKQVYEFTRPVYVGDVLSAKTTLTDAYEREGQQGGTMTFAVLETNYVEEDGTPVVTERQTIIETDGTISENQQNKESAEREANHGRATVRQSASEYDPIESTDNIEIGDSGPTVIVEGLTPQDFVRYAGASGDFNPIHYDQQYARALGNPSVFGQGMLTAGYAGHFVTDWFGFDVIRQFQNRFTARVWPGDTLTVGGEVTEIDPPAVTAEFSISRQTGETVLRGDVTASISSTDGR